MLNHPVLWMSRIHETVWRGLLLWIAWALIGTLISVSPTEEFESKLWYAISTVVGVALMCFWVYRYMIFNREKKFGDLKPAAAYLNYMLVLITCAVYLLSPIAMQIVRNERLGNVMTDSDYVNMVNDLNLGIPYTLEEDIFETQYDTIKDINYFNVRVLSYNTSPFSSYFVTDQKNRLAGILSSFELKERYKVLTDVNEVQVILERYNKASAIFTEPAIQNVRDLAERYVKATGMSRIYVNSEITGSYYPYLQKRVCFNIGYAKLHRAFFFHWEYYFVMLIICTTLTSLLLLFKMVRWQQFLISILTIMFYPLLLFLFLLLLMRNPDKSYMVLLVLTIWFCIYGVYGAWRNRWQFKPLQNIMAQLFYIFASGILLFTVIITYETTNLFHQHDLNNSGLQDVGPESSLYARRLFLEAMDRYWDHVYEHCVYASYYTGLAIFVLMQPLYKKLFAKQNALPVKS